MADPDRPPLSPLARSAASCALPDDRGVVEAGLAFDERLEGIVDRLREPAMAQLRLAWWRERLGEPPGQRPTGEPLLADLTEQWQGEERPLAELVDGWEHLVAPVEDGGEGDDAFIQGRSGLFAGIARKCDLADRADDAASHGRIYALATLQMRGRALDAIVVRAPPLPRRLRPLAVLSGLALRRIKRGEGPLLGDRTSPFALLRLGLLGR